MTLWRICKIVKLSTYKHKPQLKCRTTHPFPHPSGPAMMKGCLLSKLSQVSNDEITLNTIAVSITGSWLLFSSDILVGSCHEYGEKI